MSKAAAKVTTKKNINTPPKHVPWRAYTEVVRALKSAKDESAELEADLLESEERVGVLENNVAVSQNNISGLTGTVARLSYLLEISLEVTARTLRDK